MSPANDTAASTPAEKGQRARRRTQLERSTETIDALTKATIELMCEVGFANMTTVQIAERAGVSRGAMLHHFPSKLALVTHATGEMWNGVVKGTDALKQHSDPDRPDPRGFILALWDGAMAETHVSVTMDMTLAARGDEELRAHLDRWIGRMFRSYNAAGRRAFGKAGLKPAECDALIATIASTLRGQRMAQMYSPNPPAARAVLRMLTRLLSDSLEKTRS